MVEEHKHWWGQSNASKIHQACSSFHPLTDIVYGIVREQGIKAMNTPNEIGITPSQYLHANPFADIDEKKILKRYILDMMGELVWEKLGANTFSLNYLCIPIHMF